MIGCGGLSGFLGEGTVFHNPAVAGLSACRGAGPIPTSNFSFQAGLGDAKVLNGFICH